MKKPFDRAMLIRMGVIDEQGVNAKPKVRHCGRCGIAGWAAWEDGTCDTILVDHVALTPYGEACSWAAGRPTYHHWFGGLDLRRAEWIIRLPASPTFIVRPIHICGIPNPEHYPQTKPPQTKECDNGEIPF